MGPRESLQAILEKGLVRRVRDADAPAPSDAPTISTGITDLDGALPGGGLARGMTHEWVLQDLAKATWHPPLLLLTYLAARPQGLAAFIGQRCWPCPWTLAKVGLDFSRCLFIDPRPEERAWAIDQVLRCPGVGAVVGDVEGMDMADSRRLQLAAESGQTLGLLTRPADEIKELSASGTRWVISPRAGATDRVRWKVELRRCKAAALWAAASGGSVREWVLEWDERRQSVQVVGADAAEVFETERVAGGSGVGVQEVRREAGGVRVAPDVARRSGTPEVRRTA